MKQLNKHKARAYMAYVLVIISILLTLSTGGTEHLGWLLMLGIISLVSIFWLLYEEHTIKQFSVNNRREK